MKTKLFYALFSLLGISVNAQQATIAIPDTNFEQALIDLGKDTNGLNGNILTSDALAIDSLDIKNPLKNKKLPNVNAKIKSLNGIEEMTNLVSLEAGHNDLETVDITKNSKLKNLFLNDNKLTEINVSKNVNLERLGVMRNSIADIDVTMLPNLKDLYAHVNKLKEIDVAQNSKLRRLYVYENEIKQLNTNNNPNLERYYAWNNKLTSVDVNNNTKLTRLGIGENEIETLNISKNTNLEALWAGQNKLSSLDLSKNLKLKSLSIFDNTISNFKMPALPDLVWFNFSNNPINSVDVKASTKLRSFEGQNTALTSIDLSKNTNLEYIFIGENKLNLGNFDTSIYTKLKKIGVDNLGLTSLDFTKSPDLEEVFASKNNLSTIDFSKNSKMTRLWLNENPNISSIDVSNMINLTELGLHKVGISEINLKNNKELKKLQIGNNKLSVINTNSNIKLEEFLVTGDKLKNIDISKNLLLKELELSELKIVGYFDASQNTSLEKIKVINTQFWGLNLKNISTLNNVEIRDNSNLTCVQVDNVGVTSSWNFGNNNSSFSFNGNCSFSEMVTIKDPVFEQYLISAGLDTNGKNGHILRSDAEKIKKIKYDGEGKTNKISDLTGVEAMINLEQLRVPRNILTALDVSKNSKLNRLYIEFNQIEELDVSNNPLLVKIDMEENNVTNFSVVNNPELTKLDIQGNGISTLNLSNNAKLELLDVSRNDLTEIVTSNMPNLKRLRASKNVLTDIDVTQNKYINILYLDDNKLENIDLSANKYLQELLLNNNNLPQEVNITSVGELTNFNITNNPNTKCIITAVPGKFNQKWATAKDAKAKYAITCNAGTETVAIPDDNFEQALIDLGIDSNGKNNTILKAEAEAITSLQGVSNIENKGIKSLEGIQYMINLVRLDVDNNLIENVDVSKNTKLDYFSIQINKLKSIDVSKNNELRVFYVEDNELKSVNVLSNPKLERIDLKKNNISSIDVSRNPKLVRFDVNENPLTSIDVSNNPSLIQFKASKMPNLEVVNLKNGSNTKISKFEINECPKLACVQVDNKDWSKTNWTSVDDSSIYNEVCTQLSTEIFDRNTVGVYPNPTSNKFKINVTNNIILEKVEVYNVVGKLLLKTAENTVNIQSLPAGLYIVKITTNQGLLTKKVMKK